MYDEQKLKDGYWFMMTGFGFAIIGKAEEGTLPREDYGDDEEYFYEKNMLKEARERGYIFGRWYSEVVPDGELGSNHISSCLPMSKEEFEEHLAVIQADEM